MTTLDLPSVGDGLVSAGPARWAGARRFFSSPSGVIAVIILLILLAMAVFPRLFTSQSPTAQELADKFAGPSGRHRLGTDALGRDYYTRVIYGARTSLFAGLQATSMALLIGVPLGMIAAFARGWRQTILDRFNDGVMSLPALLLAIVIVAVLGPGLTNAMVGMGIAFAPRFYRIARASSQVVREETFIEASRALGCSTPRLLARHVLPNITPTVIVQASLTFGSAVLAEASLSFLGLGVQPPTASWGQMLQEASQSLFVKSSLIWGPGVLIVLTVMAFQLAADGLGRALGGPGQGKVGR